MRPSSSRKVATRRTVVANCLARRIATIVAGHVVYRLRRPDMEYGEQAAAIVAACRRLHARGLLAGTEGNVSMRVSDVTMLITPGGADKGTLVARGANPGASRFSRWNPARSITNRCNAARKR